MNLISLTNVKFFELNLLVSIIVTTATILTNSFYALSVVSFLFSFHFKVGK